MVKYMVLRSDGGNSYTAIENSLEARSPEKAKMKVKERHDIDRGVLIVPLSSMNPFNRREMMN